MGIQISTNKLLVRFRSTGSARLRLFCFPYAGGSASAFRSWPESVPEHIEVYAVQLPGRGHLWKEAAYTRWDELVGALAELCVPYLDRPFAFFGYSFGALVGFELARLLSRQYQLSPCHLFAASCQAPQLVRSDAAIHHLPDHAFVEGLRHFKGIPEHILQDASMMEFLLPALRADFMLYETYGYVPGPPLACALSAYGGLEDALIRLSALTCWQYMTGDAFTLRMFPGDHFFLRSAHGVLLHAVVEELARSLDKQAPAKSL
ncbi:MAG: thioesterase [Ktedonobacteraceae bacterium]|nr:thioesterase [Ktedonobacteraceae bacterium]